MSGSSGYGTSGSSPVGPVVETLTGNTGGAVGPTSNNINIIGVGDVVVTGNPGTSTLTISAGSAIADEFDTDNGTAIPSSGVLNILGGASTAGININTAGSGNTVEIILNDSILLPNTNNTGTEGVIFMGGDTFMHNYGAGFSVSNTFLGNDAGNLTLTTAAANTGIGFTVMENISTGSKNTATGSDALGFVTTGNSNCSYGYSSLLNIDTGKGNDAFGSLTGFNGSTGLETGSFNIIIGSGDSGTPLLSAGSSYQSSESNNIVLRNVGVTGDNHIIRIGTDGSSTGQQNAAYFAGIYNRSVGSTHGVVQIDSNFKLGSSNGTNGQLLIAATGTGPIWANLTSTGGSVVITNNANAINLEATGTGAGASSFPTDAGTATEAAGVLNIIGSSNMNTTGSGNTVAVALNDFISLPNTNTAADEGVLYLGSNTFLHNYGTQNTFLGQAAGNQTLTTGSATGNSGFGTNVLKSLTTADNNNSFGTQSLENVTTAEQNCAFGSLSLQSLTTGGGLNCGYGIATLEFLTTGSGNIALGSGSGVNYSSNETGNILIGNGGVNGENTTIRIGSDAEQNATYIAGIYGESIASPSSPVFIDSTGKLGTSGGVSGSEAFFAYQNGNILPPFQTTPYQLGSSVALAIIFDDGGNVFVGSGSGSPATFTAPINGKYFLSMMVSFFNSGSGFNVPIRSWTSTITTTLRTYSDQYIAPSSADNQFPTHNTFVIADMTAGDTAVFQVRIVDGGGAALGGGTSSAPLTYISGYLIQ